MSKNIATGKIGENIATDFLKKTGFHIIERNYRQKCGEIDIIAKKNKTLVFVEVKTRKSKKFGSPFEAITTQKQKQIAITAQDYLCRKKLCDKPARFDVVGITLLPGKEPMIEIIHNAFELPTR